MRRPKPFFRKQTRSWYVQIGKKQHNLGKDEDKAYDRYHELMAQQRRLEPIADESVARLLNLYLAWSEANRATSTFKKNLMHLHSFGNHIGPRLRVSQLRPHHVQRWIDDDYADLSDTYRHIAISAVKGALKWAAEQGYIDKNPVAGMQKPRPGVREFYVPHEKWLLLLDGIKDQPFRDLVTVALHTGARPQEMKRVEARHFSRQLTAWVFPRLEAKGKRFPRAVYLDETALAITERLVRKYLQGPLFRNMRGRPWTKDSINCRFRRLKKRIGMPELCMYTLRHSYAHWKLTTGTDSHIVSKLLGHTDGRMLATRYGHLEANTAFMLQAAVRTGSPSRRSGTDENGRADAPDNAQARRA